MKSNAVRRSDTPSLPPASPAEEINASRHDIVALDTRGRALREPPRRRALKFSRPRPVRPALPSRRATHAEATRAARAVAEATAAQAVATRAAHFHGSRAASSQTEIALGEPATHRGDRSAQRDAVEERAEPDRHVESGTAEEREGRGQPGCGAEVHQG